MADETVWIDLDEVESAAKTIMGLLKELEGPANRLEAKVKQVEASVYGTDLVGKALQGAGSSVGGLGKHQEQVLAGIRTLMQNATAMGQNLQSMAARHRANDEQHGSEIGRIAADGDMPADPRLPGNLSAPVGTVPASLPDAPREPLLDPDPTPPRRRPPSRRSATPRATAATTSPTRPRSTTTTTTRSWRLSAAAAAEPAPTSSSDRPAGRVDARCPGSPRAAQPEPDAAPPTVTRGAHPPPLRPRTSSRRVSRHDRAARRPRRSTEDRSEEREREGHRLPRRQRGVARRTRRRLGRLEQGRRIPRAGDQRGRPAGDVEHVRAGRRQLPAVPAEVRRRRGVARRHHPAVRQRDRHLAARRVRRGDRHQERDGP
ncbi:hypothetical protein KCH_61210 [Kitasatospora cheerisanensis KCTC 2395]|uniref:Uncharacterized protein n=1 Tax=Kitasatospora cheerisanensis KCTC 2395 TaxID=1348663 RepID=A0A066YVY8_9ACTN|nr:hypothetical protein KCH_61210 [Kitasatospora cheerisanensis KCTC 2395]